MLLKNTEVLKKAIAGKAIVLWILACLGYRLD
jgi:hypothetical protein